jgi:voltage-gated potassium channel
LKHTDPVTSPSGKFFNRLLDVARLPGKIIEVFMLVCNLLFCALFVLETYTLDADVKRLLLFFELIIAFIFIVEYVIRLLATGSRIRYLFSIYSMIDIISIIPTISIVLFPLLQIELDIGFIRIFRVFKVLRVFRFIRYTRDPHFFFGRVGTYLLRVVRFLLMILTLFFISSGLFYFMESGSSETVNSYGDAFYYTVVALTTVGFGDITPVSMGGRMVTVLMILTGIVLIPWQASHLVRAWIQLASKVEVTCERCGLQYHDRDASHCKHCGSIIYQETIGLDNE